MSARRLQFALSPRRSPSSWRRDHRHLLESASGDSTLALGYDGKVAWRGDRADAGFRIDKEISTDGGGTWTLVAKAAYARKKG